MKPLRTILCLLLAAALAAGPCQIFRTAAAAAEEETSPFSDVGPSDWAWDYILRAYTEGLMSGTYVDEAEGIRAFSPDQVLTVGEWSSLVARIFYPGETSNRPETGLFAKEVAVLSLHGAYAGVESLTASTATIICRYEMAQILYNASVDMGIPMPDEAELQRARDAIRDWNYVPEKYQTAVASMFSLGVFTGDELDSFVGSKTLSRREAAVVVCLALDHLLSSMAGTVSEEDATLSTTTHHWVSDYWSSLPRDLQQRTNQDAFNCAAQTAADAGLILRGASYDGQFNAQYNYACYVCDVMQEGTANVIQAIQLCTGFCIGTGGSKSSGYVDYFSIATPNRDRAAQSAIDGILDSLLQETTARDKVQRCMEAICERLSYAPGATATWEGGTEGDSASYTDMLAELLLAAGIPSIRVEEACSGGPRSWLQVRLNGSWVILDCLAYETSGRGIFSFSEHVQRFGYPSDTNNAEGLQIARALLAYWPQD